jgi:hypothetical protein
MGMSSRTSNSYGQGGLTPIEGPKIEWRTTKCILANAIFGQCSSELVSSLVIRLKYYKFALNLFADAHK